MKTLFSDIYNKIRDIFQMEKSENTSECATNRLQVILMHDRTKLDPLIMNKMREELIDIFSKYVVIDKEELEIGLKNEGDAVALMLNIPIIRSKTEEELEEIRKKLQEEEEKVSDSEEEDDDVQDEEENNDSDKESLNDDDPHIVDGEITEVIVETVLTDDETEDNTKGETVNDDNVIIEEE